jgi:RNA polymerase sigma-70 factor (ECF subfamily)
VRDTAKAIEDADLPDEELVRRILRGAPQLFAVLVSRHGSRIRGLIRPILKERSEVEDALQQTYLLAFAGLGRFAGASSFATWIGTIAVREALGRLPGLARLVPAGDGEAALDGTGPAADPEDRAAIQESLRTLEAALDGLPAVSRQVVVLRGIEELSTAETAARLGLTQETVKIRLHRARRALRRALAQEPAPRRSRAAA